MARNFAGGTDRIQYGGSGWNIQTGCFAFRLKTTQVTTNAAIVSVWSSLTRNGFGFILNNTANKLLVQGVDSGGTARIFLTSSSSLNDGAWHHVAFNWNTNNGGANALYVDGAPEASGNSSAAWPIASSNVPLTLGDNNNTFWPSYVGDIAEVAIWENLNLSADEIAALAKGFQAPLVKPSSLNFYAPLVREVRNLKDGFVGAVIGTAVTEHPRVIGASV